MIKLTHSSLHPSPHFVPYCGLFFELESQKARPSWPESFILMSFHKQGKSLHHLANNDVNKTIITTYQLITSHKLTAKIFKFSRPVLFRPVPPRPFETGNISTHLKTHKREKNIKIMWNTSIPLTMMSHQFPFLSSSRSWSHRQHQHHIRASLVNWAVI